MPMKIDCDSHFLPFDAFDEVDGKFSDRAPRYVFDGSGGHVVVYKARTEKLPYYMRDYPGAFFRPMRMAPGTSDAHARVQDLAKIGFDRQVLVPHNACFAYDVEPELGASVCRSYNNAAARALRKYPDKFIGLAVLPMQAVDLAIRELERAVGELGLHAPQLLTNVLDKNLDEYEFWPFYKKVEELDVPLIVHGSHFAVTAGGHRYKKYRFGNALQFPAEASLAIGSLICGGVLDAFPKLRVAVLEAGIGFLPYLFDRLNEVATEEPEYTKVSLKKMPTDYLDQLWFSFNVKVEIKSLRFVIDRIGVDRLLISSDYPHVMAGSGGSTVQFLDSLEGLSASEKEKLMGLNAVRLFRLQV